MSTKDGIRRTDLWLLVVKRMYYRKLFEQMHEIQCCRWWLYMHKRSIFPDQPLCYTCVLFRVSFSYFLILFFFRNNKKKPLKIAGFSCVLFLRNGPQENHSIIYGSEAWKSPISNQLLSRDIIACPLKPEILQIISLQTVVSNLDAQLLLNFQSVQ